jgi:hypothetical protein
MAKTREIEEEMIIVVRVRAGAKTTMMVAVVAMVAMAVSGEAVRRGGAGHVGRSMRKRVEEGATTRGASLCVRSTVIY